MKRNAFWDAQAKQYLASAGTAPNSLASLAAPGGGLPRVPVPITAIARPVTAMAPIGAPAVAPVAAPVVAAPGAMLPRTSPVRPVNPMPAPAAPVTGAIAGRPAGAAPSIPLVPKRKPAVMNTGTPFQYRVQRGVR